MLSLCFTYRARCLIVSLALVALAPFSHAETRDIDNEKGRSAASSETPTLGDLQTMRSAFLADADAPDKLARLIELEAQALAILEDEPLKLGGIGGAIVEIYPGSQTGHLALAKYYERVEAKDAQSKHLAHLEKIQAAMLNTGDGTPAKPYQVISIHDANAFARSHDLVPTGSIYQSTETVELLFMLVARPEAAKLRQIFFDVSHLVAATEIEGLDHDPNPWITIRLLASASDSAAQVSIGAHLAGAKEYDDAIGWLKLASRRGNVLANGLLARVYLTQAVAAANEGADEEEVSNLRELSMENHLHAIALGSTNSMYTLAGLYLTDYYGEDNRHAAIPLLEQASALAHTESLIYLGHLYNTGNVVDEDKAKAEDYFYKAAEQAAPAAVLNYGRFALANRALFTRKPGTAADPNAPSTAGSTEHFSSAPSTATEPDRQARLDRLFSWLDDLIKNDDAQAMVVMANLHARGTGTRPSNRRAIKWYKRAVKSAPDNADIVNEVVWTLTVSDVRGLKRAKYARTVMDALMEADEAAQQRPEYLDTWAATYAAMGNFERAIELQQQAIDVATAQDRTDVIEILRGHLEQFQRNESITEPAP